MISTFILRNTPLANLLYARLVTKDSKNNIVFNGDNIHILDALEWHWVNGNQPMSTPYWADKVGHTNLDNFIYALSEAGWIVSKANARAKWGEFNLSQAMIDKYFSREEQRAYKTKVRVAKYSMRYVDNDTVDMVKTADGIKATGLRRPGLSKSANQPFKLDIVPLINYYDAILANLTKSMNKVMQKYPTIKQDETNYAVISKELLDYYIFHQDNVYNFEGNTSDSRGRAIYNGLRRVGNPIANKDFRACMVVPQGIVISKSDTKAMREIYLFIAELVGVNAKSWGQKALAGRMAYSRRELHDIDLTTEHGRKELHENIWLERIYARLEQLDADGSVYWDIPIEIDCTMSLAQVIGTLLNDARLLDRTNVINETTLLDAWYVEGVPRLHTKTVGTPVFYGSAQTATSLLRSKKLDYTRDHVKILNKEFNTGAFGLIKSFKDFLIQYANVETPTIPMTIWNETFDVVVNKFKPVRAKTNVYSVWNSEIKRQVVFLNHTVETVPDYDRFRLYYPTGLVHNLDSKLMDNAIMQISSWAIAIHDAILCLPGSTAREKFVEQLEALRANRHTVLNNYRKSIGATSRSADIAWAKLMDKVEPLCSAIPFSESALK